MLVSGILWIVFRVFFFQAEDGIRDIGVTGVQTCALPICPGRPRPEHGRGHEGHADRADEDPPAVVSSRPAVRQPAAGHGRSEERRVGKECRSRWSPSHEKKQTTERRMRSIWKITVTTT